MKLLKLKKVAWLKWMLLSITLTGCALPQPVIDPYYSSLTPSDMYLRGTFNWWGVQESYRFTQASTKSWHTQIFLLADGSIYDFKIADGQWSPQQNCGSIKDKTTLNQKVKIKLFCNLHSQNLQFIPQIDGNYQFSIDENNGVYTLKISIIN